MGFQSGINQTLGAVAGAAFAIKQGAEAKEAKKEANKEKLTNTKLDLDFSMAELAQSEANSFGSGLDLEKAQKETAEKQKVYDTAMAKKPGGKGNTKAAIAEAQQAALDDLTAAQKAESFLKKKHTANEAMVTRFKNRVSVLQDRIKQLGGIK